VSQHPEHDKLAKVAEKSFAIGEFLDWLTGDQGIVLGRYPEGSERLWAAPESVRTLLARYFDIDENVLEIEKRAMLATAAEQHHKEIVAEQLKRLRNATADRPAHAERLEALIRHYSTSEGTQHPEDALLCKGDGVSARAADMLDSDVSHLYWWRADPGRRQRQQLQYPAHRERQRTAAARRRTSAARNTLPDMLNLDPNPERS
jgi:hypothetical protein